MQMWDNFMNDTLLCIIPIVSNLNKKRLSKSDKENLTLSEIQKETLIGVLLEEKSKDQWILYILPRGRHRLPPRGVQVRQDVKNKLSNLVKLYMHDSMMYKL